MTEWTWRDFDTHLMQEGTTRNDYFHAVTSCPRIKDPELTVDREASYVAYHEPEPCATCHPEVPTGDGADELVIVSARSDRTRYHRREDCYYAAQMPESERIRISEANEEGLEACKRCAAHEREDVQDIEVCPECDRTMIQSIVGSQRTASKVDADWRCNAPDCGARFDEPAVRPRKRSKGNNPGGLAGKLMQADPEDVSAEHAGGGSA
ncbi:hypothetical protein [Haloarcula rara]|uniref:hypothetical protein n=1 Tax=Haloarcula rara TaxID=3033387 RepID=UPI0023E8EC81|nr:hypothetical protein [Halomicroarcula sp. SHR3]